MILIESGFMRQCDICNRRYHGLCVSVTKEMAIQCSAINVKGVNSN